MMNSTNAPLACRRVRMADSGTMRCVCHSDARAAGATMPGPTRTPLISSAIPDIAATEAHDANAW
jgi:hypothetical protein